MTPEQKFYQWFRKQLPPGADCVRIETTTMGGMPDVNVCYKGKEIWVELKCLVNGRVLIRPEQNAWMHRRNEAGGEVVILANSGPAYYLFLMPLTVIPHGKYLWVKSQPMIYDNGKSLVNFLFT